MCESLYIGDRVSVRNNFSKKVRNCLGNSVSLSKKNRPREMEVGAAVTAKL